MHHSEIHQAVWSLTPQQKLLGISLLGFVGSLGAIRVAPYLPRIKLPGWKWRTAGAIQIGDIRLTDDARMRHTHIVGATGSGKTVLLEHLLYRDLARGCGALIIDPKGERDFYERVKAYCARIGRSGDLHLLSATHMEESARWNPCRLGGEAELQSKFFCSSKYEHSFYAKACELALLEAFRALGRKTPQEMLLSDLVSELDRLSHSGKDENLKGLYFDIQNLTRGEWAPILGTAPKPGNQREVSLLELTRRNEILFVDLPTEGMAVQSSRLGALLLQEITLLSGLRKRIPGLKSTLPFPVYVDEFDAFATEPFVTFLNKGRSSGFMIHMAHQTLSDLEKVSPTFLGQVMGNPNVRFIFRVDLAEDAEKIAKQFGTRSTLKRTAQTQNGQATGMGSSREVQEFRIHPDQIKELGIGECIVSVKSNRRLDVVRIPPLTDRELPQVVTPVHRKPLQDVQREERASLSEVQETYGELLGMSKGEKA